ncbi:DUF58 domain-containing protein [Ferrimonas gelatinilytica]|uniref:DUF58 domain-containing protein n=2 Tax=Ferrimonas gelatinilytica TaxID=1255257 RepID=A0ABP9RU92_9GAMM
MGFLAMALMLFLLGTNYQNNLVLILAFLLLSLFNTALLLAFRNLAGLTLAAGDGHHRHAGSPVPFDLSVSAPRPLYQISLRYAEGPARRLERVRPEASKLQLLHPTQRRGVLRPGRIRIESRYPLGLCRVWSHLDLTQSALVWPRAVPGTVRKETKLQGQTEHSRHSQPGLEDFHGLARWQPGHGRSRIAWKQLAQTGQMQSKAFCSPQGQPCHLALAQSVPLETGLSALAAELQTLEAQGTPYSLTLADARLPMAQGASHLKRCLDSLARHRRAP